MSWDLFRDEVVQSLQGVPSLTCASMKDVPGMEDADGLRSGDAFFGVIKRGRLFFRVDDATRPPYEEAGSGPLRLKAGILETYYEVPFDVREDPLELRQWAGRAVKAAKKPPAA